MRLKVLVGNKVSMDGDEKKIALINDDVTNCNQSTLNYDFLLYLMEIESTMNKNDKIRNYKGEMNYHIVYISSVQQIDE